VRFLDVHAAPLNPLAGKASLFSSIDPLRALNVLTRHRRAAAVVSYYQSGALLILALRRLFGFKPKVAIVDIGNDVGWRIRTEIVKFCIGRTDALFTFSSQQAKTLREKYRTDRIHFLPQQVDTLFYSPSPAEEGDYVLAVGGDVARDYATLSKALFESGVPLVLRTTLVAEDPRYPNVKVIRERQDDLALRDLYRRAKVVVLPLTDVLYPSGVTSLLEAYACGKAVVASASRGISDYLHHEETCLVVPCGDARALRGAVMRLMQDDALRRRIGNAARAYAERELSQPHFAKRLLSNLRQLE
jgi:glycosyltransferase involved in cell wall biosynthesis